MKRTSETTAAKEIMDFRAYEAAPGISVIVLPDAPVYTHVSVSNDFVCASGMERKDVIGKGHFAVFPKSPDDPNFTGEQNLRASFAYIIQHKVPHEIPLQRYDLPNGDGTFRQKYWKINNAPVLDEAGEVAYIVHTALDVTEHTLAQQKIESSKGMEQAYHFFMSAPVIIGYVKGDDYIIELANESLLEVWDRTSAVVGQSMFTAIPELEAQGFRALLDEVRTTGNPFYAYEYPISLFRRGREEVRYFDFVYKPFYEPGASGKAVGVLSIGHDVTDQVRSRQQFENVVQQAPDPILILKGEEMVLEVANEALFQLWKVDASAIGKPFLEILPEMKGQGFLELLQRVYRTGRPYQGYETPAFFNEPDGTTRTVYFNFTYHPYREADGRITGVLVLATDVTGQVLVKQQVSAGQEELRKSKERLELVTRATQDAIWDWDLVTNEVAWNEAIQQLFGYTAAEVESTADWWYEHLHPQERDSIVQDVHRLIDTGAAGGNFWSGEYRFRCADGSYKTVFDRGFVQHNGSGRSVRMIGSMQDITARKQTELKLEESQQKWQQLANAIPALVWTALEDGQIDFLNEHWYSYTGLTEAQSKGFGWMEALHPDDGERCLAVWNQARAQEVFYEVEVRYRRRDGQYRWFIARGVPIRNEAGKVSAWYGTSTDIQEQKMLSENLEQIVADRTEALRRSNTALEDFAYAASHDMKEPIRKIHFFSDHLKARLADKIDAESLRMFGRMQQASKRMSTLIDDLLTYAQATEGVIEKEAVDLNKKIQLVLEDLDLEIQEKGAQVIVGTMPVIQGNRRQFLQLFQNLIGNALKYGKAGQVPEVRITSSVVTGHEVLPNLPSKERDKKFHLVTVADNGIGFAQEDADRIFNVFTRLHGNVEYRGTGIGLSIVRKVIENHHGHVWAESQPGMGATFKVLLPLD